MLKDIIIKLNTATTITAKGRGAPRGAPDTYGKSRVHCLCELLTKTTREAPRARAG